MRGYWQPGVGGTAEDCQEACHIGCVRGSVKDAIAAMARAVYISKRIWVFGGERNEHTHQLHRRDSNARLIFLAGKSQGAMLQSVSASMP